jgi:hypothetical protein
MHLARSQALKRGVASTSIHKLPHVGQCDAEHRERVIGHGRRGHERDDVDVGRSERGHSILRHGLELCALQTRGCATGWRPGSSGSSAVRDVVSLVRAGGGLFRVKHCDGFFTARR